MLWFDVSPMDMSYFPVNYPKLKMAKLVSQPPVMRLIYSRPHLQGRELFHDVLRYGEYWRLGANEATEIEFFRDVTIQNKRIHPGRYVSLLHTWPVYMEDRPEYKSLFLGFATGQHQRCAAI